MLELEEVVYKRFLHQYSRCKIPCIVPYDYVRQYNIREMHAVI